MAEKASARLGSGVARGRVGQSSRASWAALDPVTKIPGVGTKRAAQLKNLGIEHVADFLTLWPRRHVDRSVVTPIGQVPLGSSCTVQGVIRRARFEVSNRRQSWLNIVIEDKTGSLQATFFHANWLRYQLKEGVQVLMTGRVERFGSSVRMTHPEFEVIRSGESPALGLVPIYPLTGDLKQRFMLEIMRRVVPPVSLQVDDPVPSWVLEQEELAPKNWAVLHEHFPNNAEELERARKRLVFDEFLRVSLAVLLGSPGKDRPGQAQNPDGPLIRQFLASLPFELTEGQQKVWQEIREDLKSSRPMARLLQGDVGSGKTVIAALTLLSAVDGGRQAVFMVPTELLAEQQFQVLSRFLAPLGLSLGLLAGKGKSLEAVREDVRTGRIDVAVGTQALLSSSVEFQDLGVVVVDEQHRFGVRQRARLSDKGFFPDMLVMTATPIPRTLALTVYGDLDVSRIEGLPPGRHPIETVHLTSSERRQAYQFVMDQVRQGRQAYVVCPLVDENEELRAKAAVDLAQGMRKISGWRVDVVHGKMASADKAKVMAAFRNHEIDVLVSTTIVEVGVDVPNASVMVIEQAERFGLAQLHQLRGRIGRGSHRSTCFLLSDPKTEEAQARVEAMVTLQDGLKLAEADLAIRGPGEILGMRQHGVAGFQLANPLKDLALLTRARNIAQKLLDKDPELTRPEHAALKRWVEQALDQALPGQVLH